jgi:hypothetical protein
MSSTTTATISVMSTTTTATKSVISSTPPLSHL